MFDRNKSMLFFLVLLTDIPEFSSSLECNNRFDIPTFTGSLGRYCEETLNSLNCSIGPRKNIDNDNTLQCRIRRQKGWDAYQKTLGDLSLCHYEDCEPSQLASLRVVRMKVSRYRDYDDSLPTIQLNFTVPKATVKRQFYTGGILMNFSSASQMRTGDYNFDTRYRLFDFSSYSYSSPDNDNTYQRILSFPCFIGFKHEPCQSDNYKVYTVMMKSFSNSKTREGRTIFTELSYNITIYSYFVYHPDKWKSTIAVAFFPGKKDVTVLFDPAPDSISVDYYNVSLFNVHNDTVAYMNRNVGQSTKHCFKDVADGMYYIAIMVISDGSSFVVGSKITKSHVFTIGNGKPNIISTATMTENVIDIKLMYIFVGSSTGVVLAVLVVRICFCRWKARKHIKSEQYSFPRVLLVYPNAIPESSNIAYEFARFCRENLHIDILNDNLKHGNNSITIETNWSLWYKEKLSNSSAAIILWTPLHAPREREDQEDSDEFNTGVRLVMDSRCKKDFKIICIYFDEKHKRSIPNAIQTKARLFHFPKKSNKFCTYILGHKLSRNITIRRELGALIYELSLNSRSMETNFHHVIPPHDSKSDEETKDIDRTLDHVSRHEFVTSKSTESEAQPLIQNEDLRKKSPDIQRSINSENNFVSSERNLQCANQWFWCSKMSDSVSSSKLFGSDELPNPEKSNQCSRDRSSECTNSSDLSISRLEFKTMIITSDDNSSQSSGYAHCESPSPFSSLTPENESGVPLCSITSHLHKQLCPVEADYDSISSYGIHYDSDDDFNIDSAALPMSPLRTTLQHRSTPDNDKYSVSSGSIRSSEIDLSEFTSCDGIS